MAPTRARRVKYDVAERSGHVEVTGASQSDVTEALDLLTQWREAQAEVEAGATRAVLSVLAKHAGPVLPPSRTAAAERLAEHRAGLLATPTHTYETLAQVRGDQTVAAARQWLTRARARGDVFTVKVDGRTLIPAFQVDSAGAVPRAVAQVNKVLLGSTEPLSGWETWSWWCAPTGLLSGQAPLDMLETARGRVEHAARRFVIPEAF